MCRLIENNRDYINRYCYENGLDAEKVFSSPMSFNNDFAFLQHVDISSPAIMDNNPAKVILKVFRTNAGIVIQQTEHTKTYLKKQ